MKKRILETLERIEWERDVEILYACESGSRAWGFASPDSDYDVRFIYTRCLKEYLTIEPARDVVELPIVDELDANGWDIRKALGLLRSSNPTLLEWLHSPVVYRADAGFMESMRELALTSMRPRSLCHHYLSMARNNWRKDIHKGKATAKRYLYTLRPILCATWVVENGSIPPVAFDALVAATVASSRLRVEIEQLLELKARSMEKDVMARNPVLDEYIQNAFEELARRLPAEADKTPAAPFDELLVDTLGA